MKLYPFCTRLKNSRKALGLTQEQLGSRVGLKAHRLSDLELARRYPTRDELRALAEVLRLPVSRLADELAAPDTRGRTSLLHRIFGGASLPALRQERARPTWIRLLHASRQHRELYTFLVEGVKQRPDYLAVQRFLRDAVADSRYEALIWLHCLNRQFFPDEAVPMRCSFRALPIFGESAQGDLRWPCLACLDPISVIMFPQVPVQTRKNPWRMDLLIGVKLGKRRFWVNGEVDGERHDASRDDLRGEQIGLPRLKLEPQEILALDFVDRLFARLRAF